MNSSNDLPGQDGRPEPQRPVWPRNLALSLAAAAAAYGVMSTVGSSDDGESGHRTASAPPATAVPAADRPAAPLDQVFPTEVKAADGTVYTRVTAKTQLSCPPEGSVGPRLAGLLKQGKGCAGEQTALYRDGHDNRFSLAVFTLRDPRDTAHVLIELAKAAGDPQVPAQTPPVGRGLPALSADSGRVQSFAGVDRVLVVGLGQWSDGRKADYQKLVDRLQPVLTGVTKNIGPRPSGV
ncbi:hypothetical protein [Kitasatospora sp. NPDC090091]|uniref:hypothetical protein n=1 Tax=Kitasatospora sp. NPDC090091 TaxID=3364081 RepID=UPI00382DA5E2